MVVGVNLKSNCLCPLIYRKQLDVTNQFAVGKKRVPSDHTEYAPLFWVRKQKRPPSQFA